MKAISAGVENNNVVGKGFEALTLKPESGRVLWEKSEAAVGTLSFA